MKRLAALTGVVLLLGACAAFAPPSDLPAGWIAPRPAVELAQRHCYRTLAEVDCHAGALPGEESRRVGFFDTPLSP